MKFVIGLLIGLGIGFFAHSGSSSNQVRKFFTDSGKTRVQVISKDLGASTSEIERAVRESWASVGDECGTVGFREIDQFREDNDLVSIGECREEKKGLSFF